MFCYTVNEKFFYLGTSKELSLKHSDLVSQVLQVYKVPKHLTNVMIVIQSLTAAHKGLVFKGQDSRDRWQYFYGREYTTKRSESRLETVKRVHKIWPQLIERMNLLLSSEVGSLELQLGFILLFLTKTFIRTGKHIHYRENKTQGLITLKKANIIFERHNTVRLQFIGKDKVKHNISLSLDDDVFKKLKSQSEWVNDFVFSYKNDDGKIDVIKEFVIYEFLDDFNIRPKDIRTYGANLAFLEAYLSLMNEKKEELSKSSYKKLVAKAVELAALKIGHTKNVSKRSYISQQLYSFVEELYDRLDEVKVSRILKKTNIDLLQFFLKS